eukprot:scaffold872_cov421-Prasinococcus_capsulatus_cf.AAC.18
MVAEYRSQCIPSSLSEADDIVDRFNSPVVARTDRACAYSRTVPMCSFATSASLLPLIWARRATTEWASARQMPASTSTKGLRSSNREPFCPVHFGNIFSAYH